MGPGKGWLIRKHYLMEKVGVYNILLRKTQHAVHSLSVVMWKQRVDLAKVKGIQVLPKNPPKSDSTRFDGSLILSLFLG